MKFGDPLLNSDTVSRYCSSSRYDRIRCEPKVAAFQERVSERCDYSVNRLQHYGPSMGGGAVDRIREEFVAGGFDRRAEDRFVVLNVGRAIEAAAQRGVGLSVIFTPNCPYVSHSSIRGLPDPKADQDMSLRVAAAIKRIMLRDDVYPAVV